MTNSAVKSAVLPQSDSDLRTVFQPEIGSWVALRNAPSDYSHDEAILLCETFSGEWISLSLIHI